MEKKTKIELYKKCIGLRINDFTCVGYEQISKWKSFKYFLILRCECGRKRHHTYSIFIKGNYIKCKCKLTRPNGLRVSKNRRTIIIEGATLRQKSTINSEGKVIRDKEYCIWYAMKQRCLDSNCIEYKNYGGRGIKICDRWLNSFDNFITDMGRRENTSLSIDRINNDGNYEPGNCRWATREQQANNKRTNVLLSQKKLFKINKAKKAHKYECILSEYPKALKDNNLLKMKTYKFLSKKYNVCELTVYRLINNIK